MHMPDFKIEHALWKKGYRRVAGIDEAGRGALAGPVVAAAVLINSKVKIQNFPIKESKQLTARQREKFYHILTQHPHIEWGIGIVSERVIDRVNILQATKLAMEKAVENLQKKIGGAPDILLLDGNFTINVPVEQRAFVKGDALIYSCAASSIIAKVTRDHIMKRLRFVYPAYGFDVHKGYGTALHLAMLKKHGPCPAHRKSFRPVCQAIAKPRKFGIV